MPPGTAGPRRAAPPRVSPPAAPTSLRSIPLPIPRQALPKVGWHDRRTPEPFRNLGDAGRDSTVDICAHNVPKSKGEHR